MKFGEPVKAYPLDESGPKLGHYLGSSDQEGKDKIQVGAEFHALAYREPADYTDAGPNGTYCSVA